MNYRRWFDVNWHRLAWFDVHRARLWQVIGAALVLAAFTFFVTTVILAAIGPLVLHP